jgi:hypothetical protein
MLAGCFVVVLFCFVLTPITNSLVQDKRIILEAEED